jgi:parallel beta helix pectate lyase-like protein
MKSFQPFLLAAGIAVFASIPAFARSIYVDNHASPNGDGTSGRPFTSLAAASQASEAGDEIYVAASPQPYAENIELKPQQKLTGTPQGAGPAIHGMVTVSMDNTISYVTIANDRGNDVYGATSGSVTLRDVHLRTSNGGYGLLLVQQAGTVNVSGGDLEGTSGGNGIAITAGAGAVVLEHFPIHGSFGSAITVSDRLVGAVTIKEDCEIRIDDASKDAIVISNMGARAQVRIDAPVTIRGHARGLVVFNVPRLMFGAGGATIATVNGTALDVRNSGGDIAVASVSAEGAAPGTLRDGIVIDSASGSVAIGSPKGSGGTIRNASAHGVIIDSSRNVHIAGLTLVGCGTPGTKEPRHAAFLLHNVDGSAFDNITINGGGTTGIDAAGPTNVTFSDLVVRGAAGEGMLLQEASGVTISRGTFSDGGGSEIAIRQHSAAGRVVLDRCTLFAAEKPGAAAHLLDVAASGTGKLELVLQGGELRDNAGAAINANASDTASLALSLDGVSAAHVGTGALMAATHDTSRLSVAVRAARLSAPAAPAVIDVQAADHGIACVNIAGNQLSGAVAIHLAATDPASLRLVGAANARALAAANGGAVVKIDGAATTVAACE